MPQKQILYAVTLHRPWSWAIACLDKDVENREYECSVPIGNLIAIHSGKTWSEEGARFIESINSSALITLPTEPEHPTGIIAIAQFKGNVTDSQSEWFSGSIGWVLSDVVAFRNPVPCRGQQRLWKVPQSILPDVRSEYKAALKHKY